MTAHFLPPIAAERKPERVLVRHPDVGGDDLAGVPGTRGLPLLGILPEAVLDPLKFAARMYERYGPVHKFRACGSWNVQLVGPEANEFVLFDRDGNFSAEGGWRPVFGRHFDGGLLLRDGEDHRWHRKLVAIAFKQDQLQHYLAAFCRNMTRMLPDWSGRSRDAYALAQRLTFGNGYEAFLGRDSGGATERDLLAFRYLMRSATSVLPFPFPGNSEWRAGWAKRHVASLIAPMMAEAPAPERTDLLAVLVRMRSEGLLEDWEILSHLTFVIAASFDTLSSATASILYFLAAHPEWQERVRSELVEAIPYHDRMQLEEVQRCALADGAIKEALRLNAAAPVLWRRAVKPYRFAGHSFPAGTITGVNPMLTHLMPEIWPDPSRFDPTRFAPDEVRARHRYAFVPFGAGAHGCIGANFASLQIRALLRIYLERHALRLTDPAKPAWYHWPNCRPRRRLEIALDPL